LRKDAVGFVEGEEHAGGGLCSRQGEPGQREERGPGRAGEIPAWRGE
jgi:hypothetical protein